MVQRWTLLIEGLGKIERAEVEIRPLMLFVGENNSGKSYLATLLWGLLALHDELDLDRTSATFQTCDAWLTRHIHDRSSDEPVTYVMTEDDKRPFIDLFNELLDTNKQKLVEGAFNHPGVRVDHVSVTPSGTIPLMLHVGEHVTGAMPWESLCEGEDLIVTAGEAPELDIEERSNLIKYISIHLCLEGLLTSPPQGDPLFLPASRTGFMLLYKSVVSQQIGRLRRTRSAKDRQLNLPTPAIQFLDMLAVGLKAEPGPYAEEAAFLEGALQGHVEVSTDVGVNDYRYRPTGGEPLDMSIVSSLVTELAPIVLVLRYAKPFPVLILEEPEAHLHPAMQRHLARTVVRLIRKGLCVWITTHSENFCQQLNNFLKIGCSPKRAELQAKLGYEPHEYLTLDDVSGYGFTLEAGKTKVAALKETPRGLVMPTFNRELARLTQETLFLQRETTEET